MSTNSSDTRTGSADDVRRAFASLSFDEKITTLLRVELDMVGDVVETVVSAASRLVDEAANAFNRVRSSPSEPTSADL